MHKRTGLVAGLLAVGLLFSGTTVSAEDLIEPVTVPTSSDPIVQDDNDTTDPYQTLPSDITNTINLMTADACDLGLRVLESQGWTPPDDSDSFGHEYDPLSQRCKDFRDTLEHRTFNGQEAPFVQHCNYIYGVTCLAVGHYACDFAIVVGSGLVYYCLGGITPYN